MATPVQIVQDWSVDMRSNIVQRATFHMQSR